MILLDSLYINNSGGLRLLDYLVRSLQRKKISFFLLADLRCKGQFDDCDEVKYLKASLSERRKFYKLNEGRFTSVLCFGNIPTPIKMNVPVYTYFHNINRLDISVYKSFTLRFRTSLKRIYIKSLKKNTDKWIVQTQNVKNEMMKHFKEEDERILIMPFYELTNTEDVKTDVKERSDYVYISGFNAGNKGHKDLFDAWNILYDKGIKRTLHLTIEESQNPGFLELKKKYDFEKLQIINHGFIDFKEVVDLYHRSKAIIYPSRNESLGLGLIEAIYYGCDVVGADLPYTYSVCEPSEAFDPYSPESIACAVETYEKGESKKTKLVIKNNIDELISLINK